MEVLEAGKEVTLEQVQEMINDVDENSDGLIQLPEFLKLVSDNMLQKEPEEEMIELFKAFGP